MEVKLRLFATLRKKLPPGSKAGKAVLTLDRDATIRDVIQQLDIPEDLAQMVLVNGETDPRVRSGLGRRRQPEHLSAGGRREWIGATPYGRL